VKMVMPETRPDSPTLRKAARKNAVLRTARRAVAPRVAQWVVLTEWRESEMPAHLVFAVEPMERGSYAAVATPNGWLIVQI